MSADCTYVIGRLFAVSRSIQGLSTVSGVLPKLQNQ